MEISLEKVEINQREKLENLLQLYLHDLSLYFPLLDFDSNTCKYKYDLDKYFDKDYAYFIKSNNEILGFILIDNNLNNNYEISEMFILNQHKNKKLGSASVEKVFEMYKGNWVVKTVPLSSKAESFWDKTISNYTNGNYKLEHTGKYNRAEFYFENK